MATFLLNNNLTQIAAKRLSGKAMTNSKLAIPEEAFGSSVQTLASTVFAEALPNEPNNASNQIYLIQSESNAQPGTVMLVDFDVVPIGSSQYINTVDGDTNADLYAFAAGTSTGQNTTNTYHAYILKLTGSFQADLENIGATYFGDNASTGTALGSDPFASGFTTSGSLKLQIVPEYASTLTSGNTYVPKISQLQDPEDFANPISATSPEDIYLDPFAGILFIQDPVDYATGTGNVPGKVRAFIYVGKYQDEVTFSASDVNFIVSGSDEGFAVSNDDTINFVSGSAGITVESNNSSGTITIGESTDNITVNQITASIINADTIEVSEFIVSSSVTYMTQSFSSGSTIFGDTNDDTHQFTGSLQILHTGSTYGFQMSGSNFLIDYGDSGSVTLGEYNVGAELGGFVGPITGSGLIISSAFSNQATHHNMVKIGETELVDVSGSAFGLDAFLINVKEKALVISSSFLDRPVAAIEAGNTSFYGLTSNVKVININGDNLSLGASNNGDTTLLAQATLRISSPTTRIRVPNDTPLQDSHLIVSTGDPDNNNSTLNDDSKLISTPLTSSFPYLGGAITASAVSSSGDLFASLSLETTAGADVLTVVYDTGSGQFFYTGSYGAADTTELEASASAGIFLSASQGTGFSIGLMQSASFTSGSGDGLTVEAGVGTNNIEFTLVGVLSSSAQIATDISGAIDAATGSVLLDYGLLSGSAQIATEISGAIGAATASLSASIVGTANEVEVIGTLGGTIQIGLPDDVTIAGTLDVNGSTLATDETTFNLLDTNATTINFGGAATTIDIGAAGASTVNIKGSASIDGDLIVKGVVTSVETDNLNVQDQFILLNSGSGTTTLDGGIIIRQTAAAEGAALFLDSSVSRFAVAKGVAWDNTSDITTNTNSTMEYIVTVTSSAGTPTTVEWGDADFTSYGNMYVDTDNGDIYIYGG